MRDLIVCALQSHDRASITLAGLERSTTYHVQPSPLVPGTWLAGCVHGIELQDCKRFQSRLAAAEYIVSVIPS